MRPGVWSNLLTLDRWTSCFVALLCFVCLSYFLLQLLLVFQLLLLLHPCLIGLLVYQVLLSSVYDTISLERVRRKIPNCVSTSSIHIHSRTCMHVYMVYVCMWLNQGKTLLCYRLCVLHNHHLDRLKYIYYYGIVRVSADSRERVSFASTYFYRNVCYTAPTNGTCMLYICVYLLLYIAIYNLQSITYNLHVSLYVVYSYVATQLLLDNTRGIR